MNTQRCKVSDSFLNDIRSNIKTTRVRLRDNKHERKKLIRCITDSKLDIKSGEHVCSYMENARLGEKNIQYVRNELVKKRLDLESLQEELVILEIDRAVELAKFRALHDQLDKLGVPFDPLRKAKKDALRRRVTNRNII